MRRGRSGGIGGGGMGRIRKGRVSGLRRLKLMLVCVSSFALPSSPPILFSLDIHFVYV